VAGQGPAHPIADLPGGADRQQRRLDLAARAAWLYYVGEKTQDEIAAALNLSRQGAQRLLALARSAGLVRFRLDRRMAECAEAAERLRARFGLRFCDVVPSSGVPISDVAVSAAEQIEARLASLEPIILALGSGRTLRAAVQQVSPVHRPQHRIVALVGNLTHAGRASPFEVASRLADLTAAQCHPMPLPVLADTAEEAAQMRAQRVYQLLHELVRKAATHFVGVGNIAHGAPLHNDGFVSGAELDGLLALGAVGEICGRTFDRDGRIIAGGHADRVMAIPFDDPPDPDRIGVSAGPTKVFPITAALRGRWLSGLITDEVTAAGILGL
jgi:DNA-binding transcriptional regulator LsrR (DeoR family)